MRRILLSMQPFWFEKVLSGEKIYEYRNRFPNEEIEAYIYVSNPVKAIAGILYLGPRIEVKSWKDEYSQDRPVRERIESYIDRNKYAMPILAAQRIREIKVEEMKNTVSKFIIPESYYYLENYKNIEEAIMSRTEFVGDKLLMDEGRFEDKNEICRNYRL